MGTHAKAIVRPPVHALRHGDAHRRLYLLPARAGELSAEHPHRRAEPRAQGHRAGLGGTVRETVSGRSRSRTLPEPTGRNPEPCIDGKVAGGAVRAKGNRCGTGQALMRRDSARLSFFPRRGGALRPGNGGRKAGRSHRVGGYRLTTVILEPSNDLNVLNGLNDLNYEILCLV